MLEHTDTHTHTHIQRNTNKSTHYTCLYAVSMKRARGGSECLSHPHSLTLTAAQATGPQGLEQNVATSAKPRFAWGVGFRGGSYSRQTQTHISRSVYSSDKTAGILTFHQLSALLQSPLALAHTPNHRLLYRYRSDSTVFFMQSNPSVGHNHEEKRVTTEESVFGHETKLPIYSYVSAAEFLADTFLTTEQRSRCRHMLS